MDKSFEIKGYINNVLKETGLEGADAFDKALLLNALGKLEAAEHSDEYKDVITGELDKLIQDNTINIGENDLVNYMYGIVLERMILLLILPNRQRHSHGQNQVILQAQKVADAYVLLLRL